jgi:Zn-dependent protease with chaperone function
MTDRFRTTLLPSPLINPPGGGNLFSLWGSHPPIEEGIARLDETAYSGKGR